VQFISLISDYNITSALVQAPIAWSEETAELYATGKVINLPAIAITIAISFILIIGIRETVIVNLTFVIIKILILLIFIFAGCIYVDRKNYAPFFPSSGGIVIRLICDKIDKYSFFFIDSFGQYGVTGMLHASTFVFFAYVGFESVTAVAQEAKERARTLPLALILSLVISILIYVGVCTVMVGLVPYKVLDTTYPLSAAVYVAIHF
jgi:APA family basic amino acid/polyamine antiporter